MGFKLASLFVEVGADDKPLNATLAGIRGKLSKLAATRFNIPGGGFAAALGIGAAGAGIAASIKGASDLAETMSKVGAVFGSEAGVVTKSAQEMADSFGIPKREFLDAASQFGLIATGMGKTQKEAAGMSAKFARLAADAASFYNVPVDVALEKIRAGLTGESEPLKAFGVIMDETTTKAYAVSAGLARKGQELSNSQKLAARAALIEKGLATATGDLARTQDGAANQARKFWGSLTNLGDTIGSTLLPQFTRLLGLLNEVATDMGTAATAGQGSWSGFFETFGSGIETVSIAYRNWGDIVERTGIMIGGWLTNIGEYLAYLGAVSGETGKFITGAFQFAFEAVTNAAVNAKDNLINIFQEIWNYIKSGGKDPIEFKLKVLTEGFEGKLPEFKMPKLDLSNVDDQLAEVDRKMQAREDARGAKAFDAAQKAKAGAPGAPGGPAAGPSGKSKGGVTDADAYAKELTEGALKSGDVANQQLKVAESMDAKLDQIAKNTSASGRPATTWS